MKETTNSDKIKVSVYYEALCTDSRYFILKQLVPTYEALQEHIKLDFVPYGKAKVNICFHTNYKITYPTLFFFHRPWNTTEK